MDAKHNTLLSVVIYPGEGLRRERTKWWEETKWRRQRNQTLWEIETSLSHSRLEHTSNHTWHLYCWPIVACKVYKKSLFQRHVLLHIKYVSHYAPTKPAANGKRKMTFFQQRTGLGCCFIFQGFSLLSVFQCKVFLLKDNLPVFIW